MSGFKKALGILKSEQWKNQEVIVEGRRMPLHKMVGGKLFHGSPHDLKDGTILEPRRAPTNYPQSSKTHVSVTSSAKTAMHWGSQENTKPGHVYLARARDRQCHVYEVEPLGDVEGHRVGPASGFSAFHLYEGRVQKARIIRKHATYGN